MNEIKLPTKTQETSLEDYRKKVEAYLKANMNYSTEEINQELKEYEKILVECFNQNWKVSSVATMIAENL